MISISDYFKENENLTIAEFKEVEKIRNEINFYKKVSEQYEYIEKRRKDRKNLDFDEQYFGIPRHALINRHFNEGTNVYWRNNVNINFKWNYAHFIIIINLVLFLGFILLVSSVIFFIIGISWAFGSSPFTFVEEFRVPPVFSIALDYFFL